MIFTGKYKKGHSEKGHHEEKKGEEEEKKKVLNFVLYDFQSGIHYLLIIFFFAQKYHDEEGDEGYEEKKGKNQIENNLEIFWKSLVNI